MWIREIKWTIVALQYIEPWESQDGTNTNYINKDIELI